MTITPEQIAFRVGKIGASEAASALGHGYGSKTRVWFYHKFTGKIVDDFKGNFACDVGNFMEPLLLKQYSKETGREAVEAPDTFVHPDEERIICHLDGVTLSSCPERIVEIKNVGPHMKSAWAEKPPMYYYLQCAVQSMIAKIPNVDLYAYFGGNDREVYEFTFTEEDWTSVYDGLKDFLDYVDRGICPPLTAPDLPLLETYFNLNSAVGVEAKEWNAEIRGAIHGYKALKDGTKLSKDDKATMNELEFIIKKHMENANTLINRDGDVIATWKAPKSKWTVDWEAVCDELKLKDELTVNEAIRNHTTETTPTRRFTVKGEK